MWAGGFCHMAGLARVIMNFDHEGIGREARSFVESHRRWMIEMAGVHPKAIDRLFPGLGDGGVHEGAAKTLAN